MLLTFLLITMALLIVVSVYCYLTKYWEVQKLLLQFYITSDELWEVLY